MKTLLPLLIAAVLSIGASELRAAPVPTPERVAGTFTGTVIQGKNINGVVRTVAVPLTKSWILKALGHPEVNPAKAFFFYVNGDGTNDGSYILADSTGTTVYGTVLVYPTTNLTNWEDGRLQAGIYCDNVAMFGGQLTGTEFDANTSRVSGGKFLVGGSIEGVPTIVNGAFRALYPAKPAQQPMK